MSIQRAYLAPLATVSVVNAPADLALKCTLYNYYLGGTLHIEIGSLS